jgi:creatinine amidohydrolase
MSASTMWKELTAQDLGELAKAGAVVILPVASMEQHGPHLPVGVDTILCEGVCRAAADRIRHQTPVVVAPTLWCGMAEHHMAFGGTFTFDIPIYRAILIAFLKSIERAGFKRVAVVNGHGGNVSALNAFLPDFARETALDLVVTTYFELALPALGGILEDQNSVLHACEMETSLMMVLAPGTVKHDRIAEAVGPNFANSRDVLMPPVQRFRSLNSFAANGVVGDARRASRAKGEALLGVCSRTLGDMIADPKTWGQGRNTG